MSVIRGLWGLNRADLRLVAAIGIIALLAWAPVAWRLVGAPADPGRKVFIVTTPASTTVLPADQDTTYTVTGPLGTTVVEVVGGRARIAESPCPQPDCHSGWVDRPGERRVCLPNMVVLEASGRDAADARPGDRPDTPEYDAETH